MPDLVGTCPKDFWESWIAEGDAAGTPETGQEWWWFTRAWIAKKITPGERFYVVAHGKLRGYATVTRVGYMSATNEYIICRRGGAVACTIAESIPGFRGLRERWWDRAVELPFEDWRTP